MTPLWPLPAIWVPFGYEYRATVCGVDIHQTGAENILLVWGPLDDHIERDGFSELLPHNDQEMAERVESGLRPYPLVVFLWPGLPGDAGPGRYLARFRECYPDKADAVIAAIHLMGFVNLR